LTAYYDILRVEMSGDRPTSGDYVAEIDLLARQPDGDVEAMRRVGRPTS